MQSSVAITEHKAHYSKKKKTKKTALTYLHKTALTYLHVSMNTNLELLISGVAAPKHKLRRTH